jgi:ABC-type amino acid transport substrate-binding protein
VRVATRKADVTFAEPNTVYYFSKHNLGAVQNITRKKPVRVFPNVFMFNTGEEKFKAMLNTTLDEISNSGDLENIISRNEPYPKDYLRVAVPYQR